MVTTLLRVTLIYGGVHWVANRYIEFISSLGQSPIQASNAFWTMAASCAVVGFVATARFPIRKRPRWSVLALVTVGLGFGILRASPEGYLLLGVSEWANSWVPPLLSTILGCMIGSEVSR